MKSLLDEEDVVRNVSAFNEASLIFWNDTRKNCLQSVCYNLSENFIASVAE